MTLLATWYTSVYLSLLLGIITYGAACSQCLEKFPRCDSSKSDSFLFPYKTGTCFGPLGVSFLNSSVSFTCASFTSKCDCFRIELLFSKIARKFSSISKVSFVSNVCSEQWNKPSSGCVFEGMVNIIGLFGAKSRRDSVSARSESSSPASFSEGYFYRREIVYFLMC